MKYQVTQEQYNNLIRARDIWPERMSYTLSGFNYDNCVLNYLTLMAFLNEENVCDRFHIYINKRGFEKLQEVYGIPKEKLKELQRLNSNFFMVFGSSKKRSKRVFKKFSEILSNVEIINRDDKDIDNLESKMERIVSHNGEPGSM